MKTLNSMTEITVQELQEYFDEYMDRVRSGETFLITSEEGDVVLMPIDDYEELIRITNQD
jgi:prevent-host-death family protein